VGCVVLPKHINLNRFWKEEVLIGW